MKKSLVFYCFCQMIFETFYGQNSSTVFNDTSINFSGDLPVSLYLLGNDNMLLQIRYNDSTYLYKEYSKNKSILLKSYQCDLNGYRNGYSYSFDTTNFDVYKEFYLKGGVINSVGINHNLDTISFIKKVNDTLYLWMEIKGGLKKEWMTNSNSLAIYNGYYRETNIITKKLILEGNYRAINEEMVVDKKKYTSILKKYNLGLYCFRGIPFENEIPVGIWYFYNENGELYKTIKYDWEDSVKNVN